MRSLTIKNSLLWLSSVLVMMGCTRMKFVANDQKKLTDGVSTADQSSVSTTSTSDPNSSSNTSTSTTTNTTTNNTTTTTNNNSTSTGSTTDAGGTNPNGSTTSTTGGSTVAGGTTNSTTGGSTVAGSTTNSTTGGSTVAGGSTTSTTGGSTVAGGSTTSTTGGSTVAGSTTTTTNTTTTAGGTTTSTGNLGSLTQSISQVMSPTITKAEFIGGKFIITGTNLINLADGTTNVSLASQALNVIEKTAQRVVAVAMSSFNLKAKVAYSLAVTNAYGAAAVDITFTLDGITSIRDANGVPLIGINNTTPKTALDVNGVITGANVNQAPVFSKKTGTTRFIAPAAQTWRPTGEILEIVVPPNQIRKYRLSLRQTVYNQGTTNGYAFITLSDSPVTVNGAISGRPKGMGVILELLPPAEGWHTVNSEGYVELDGGTGGKTFTYYVLSGGWGSEIQFTNAISDLDNYSSVIAWPM